MMRSIQRKQTTFIYRVFSAFLTFTFVFSSIIPPQRAYAQTVLNLPQPGVMVTTSPTFIPPVLKGLIINPDNPFQFDFILDSGDSKLTEEEIKEESTKLIKYFLASLTMPEDELWVNLSPYEKDRIIPDEFGKTEMGRDLLAQDYLLKQLTASLIYPEDEFGKKFWEKVYEKANRLYGSSEIPVNTFNKVWIIPDKALIYENGDRAFIVETHMKVMLEEDYLALEQNSLEGSNVEKLSEVSSSIIREVIIPEIEKEVNNGKNFAKLRQIYHSFILAAWYKKNLHQSILSQKYVDQKKVVGLETNDKNVKDKIYQQYLNAFEKGVYDFIKEDYDETTQEIIPRKYFSGGVKITSSPIKTQQKIPEFSEDRYRISAEFRNLDSTTGVSSPIDEASTGEIFDVLDVNSNPIMRKKRSIVHREGDFHQGAQAFIVRQGDRGQIQVLLQRRSSTDIASGQWDHSIATQFLPNDGYNPEQAIRRGLSEELGIEESNIKSLRLLTDKVQLLAAKRYSENAKLFNREFIDFLIIELRDQKEIQPNHQKVAEVRWVDLEVFNEAIQASPDSYTKNVRFYVLNSVLRGHIETSIEAMMNGRTAPELALFRSTYYSPADNQDVIINMWLDGTVTIERYKIDGGRIQLDEITGDPSIRPGVPVTPQPDNILQYLANLDQQKGGYLNKIQGEFTEGEYLNEIVIIASNNLALGYATILSEILETAYSLLGKRILEVDSGPGNFLHVLEYLGADVTGLDSHEEFVTFAGRKENHLNMVQGELIQAPPVLLGEPFDITIGRGTFDSLKAPDHENRPVTRLEEYQTLINLSKLTRMGGVSIQQAIDMNVGLPFTDKELELAGFEIERYSPVKGEFTNNFVRLRKVKEPELLERFEQYLSEQDEDIDRPGNSIIVSWMSSQSMNRYTNQDELLGLIEDFLQGVKANGKAITKQDLRRWIDKNQLLKQIFDHHRDEGVSSPVDFNFFGEDGSNFYRLALGTAGFGGKLIPGTVDSYSPPSQEQVNALLMKALEKMGNREGIVMIDTADQYWISQKMIEEFFTAHPDLRDKFYIATKWGLKASENWNEPDYSIENLEYSVRESERRLGRIELLYIHFNTSTQKDDFVRLLHEKDGVVERMKEMRRNRYAGIKHIGILIPNGEMLELAVNEGLLDSFDVIQMNATTFLSRPDLVGSIRSGKKAIVLNSIIRKADGEKRRTVEGRREIFYNILGQDGAPTILTGTLDLGHLDENIEHVEGFALLGNEGSVDPTNPTGEVSSPVDGVVASSSHLDIQNPGGIDFNPNYLNIQSQGNRVELPTLNNSQQFQNIEIKGLVPFIFNITPITNIPMILGESQEQSDEFSLSQLEVPGTRITKPDSINRKKRKYLEVSSLNEDICFIDG